MLQLSQHQLLTVSIFLTEAVNGSSQNDLIGTFKVKLI